MKKENLSLQYKKSLKRLKEVLDERFSLVVRDSSIKRFELSYDLLWKLLKVIFREDFGIEVNSPKSAFKEAFAQKIIEYDDFLLELIEIRNETVHTYDEELANEVYKKLSKCLEIMTRIYKKLQKLD